jgi:LysM repeat protein/lipoprotein-anchoring transpeptidase ErfK/SrfK
MLSGAARLLLILATPVFAPVGTLAQATPGKPVAQARIEPGLEDAVKWKWRVAPSDPKDWGLEVPDLTRTAIVAASPALSPPQPESRDTLYEVKRGDALILIAKRFGVTVAQIKELNGLKGDTIRIGQILKIPTAVRQSAITPPPQAASTPPVRQQIPAAPATTETGAELESVRLQVFLDRELFSPGPITGKPSPTFQRVLFQYQSTHEDAKDDASLAAKALAAVPNVFTRYILKAEDFRFIAPPKAQKVDPKHPATATRQVPMSYEQLTASPMLVYRTSWEFVAERFHCQESYLRRLNAKLPDMPGIGAEFTVPNVVPFEIKNALDEPLQPQADPQNPVAAAVIARSQLNIYRSGALVALMPLSPARPDLYGKGSWTILDVVPRPRLGTFQEEWKEPARRPAPLYGSSTPQPSPTPFKPKLSSEQYLAAGPRNPAGILWMNLAKSNSPDPLPYGLTGTSIPDQMTTQESIGGLRLTNWDIARAVRLLPPGTPLEWRQQ